MCRRSDRACRPARGHERGLCNNMLERMQSIGKQGCPGGCKATDGGWEVCGARGARGTSPPRAISASPPTVGRARTVVANPRNRDSHGGGKLRNLFADYVHPPPSTDLKNAECVPPAPRGAGLPPREKKWRFCGAFSQNLRENHGVPHTDRTVSMRRDRMRGAGAPRVP